MKLMFKDVEVYNINSNIILTPSHLPPFLRRNEITPNLFDKWLIRRAEYVTRSQTKLLVNSTGFPTDQDDKAKLWIMYMTRAISVEDCYWIKGDNENKYWNDVNPLYNKRINTLLPALFNISEELKDATFETVEYTTGGTVDKAWKREDGIFYLYKTKRYEYELLASDILTALNIPHVMYTKSKLFDIDMCKCPNMADEYYSRVPASEVRDTYKDYNTFISYVFKLDPERFATMCIVDYLICNQDRHGKNWGFYMHNSTGDLVGLHPLFDHNWSFGELAIRNDVESKVFPGNTLKEVAHGATRFVQLTLKKDLLPDTFTEMQYEYFIKACDYCNIKIT